MSCKETSRVFWRPKDFSEDLYVCTFSIYSKSTLYLSTLYSQFMVTEPKIINVNQCKATLEDHLNVCKHCKPKCDKINVKGKE